MKFIRYISKLEMLSFHVRIKGMNKPTQSLDLRQSQTLLEKDENSPEEIVNHDDVRRVYLGEGFSL